MNNKVSQKRQELWKFIKFNITVVVTSVIDIISYLILLYTVFKPLNAVPLPNNALLSLLGISYKGYLFSYLISTSIGYIAAYLINRKITFHSNINPVYSSSLYFLLAVVNILISSWLGGVFGSFITARGISNPITEIISKFIIINIPVIWTYPIERYIIQINKKDKSETVIAVDLDGTLLNSSTAVSQENLDAIKRLAEREIKTVILTGRTFYEIPEELRSCEYIDYFVYSNGAGIQSADKGEVYYSPIERETAKQIYGILNSYETFIEVYSNQTPFVDKSKYNMQSFEYYEIDENFIPEIKRSRKPIDNLSRLFDDASYKVEMFDVFFKSIEERSKCKERLYSAFSDIEITASMKNNLEIIKKDVNKGSGLKTLCRIAGYKLDNIIVIGDSENDISAFKVAKRCYAVSNANTELKKIADEVICSNDDNVMCYMEKML